MFSAKKLFLLLFFICMFNIFGYDYRWPIDYRIKNYSLDYINKIIWDFVLANTEFHVYTMDVEEYKLQLKLSEPYELSEYAKNWMTREGIYDKNWYHFPTSVEATVYLKDVDAAIHFFLLRFKTGEICLRLSGYGIEYELIEAKVFPKKTCKWFSFNDVEPTKQEIPIKKSFEKNFLSKLPLEWEYEKPAALDRYLSKLLSLFRKRKNFVDEQLY